MNAFTLFMDDGLELFIDSYYEIHIFFTDFICKQYEQNAEKLFKNCLQAPANKTKQAVLTAVRAGYRFIDCANDYDNEHVIGEALQQLYKEGTVKREDLFIQERIYHFSVAHTEH